MTRLRRILLATLLALSFSAGAAAETLAHNYYTYTYCYNRILYRGHMHGIYDVAGREVGHSNHGHPISNCV